MERYQLFINGRWEDPHSGEWFDTNEPFSGNVWAKIPRGDAQDADRAVTAAHQAFLSADWSGLTATQRGHCCESLRLWWNAMPSVSASSSSGTMVS